MKINKSSENHVYGRRKGRPLRIRKSRLMVELLPKVLISLTEGHPFTPATLFSGVPHRIVFEVGFGGGEHLVAQAKLHPQDGFIGCEPFVNGVASLLDHLDREALENVKVFNDDARKILDALPEECLDQCFVLFADPWPKKRHEDRRFIGPQNLSRIARVLKSGSTLRVASDHPSLIEWMRTCLEAHPDFVCSYTNSVPPSDWVNTRYQEKAIEAGRVPHFLDYCRK